jgi:hypothetical protein
MGGPPAFFRGDCSSAARRQSGKHFTDFDARCAIRAELLKISPVKK